MPGMPEEDAEINAFNSNVNGTVREITQTDHLNKKLLASYLNNINSSKETGNSCEKPERNDEDEEQNWEA